MIRSICDEALWEFMKRNRDSRLQSYAEEPVASDMVMSFGMLMTVGMVVNMVVGVV